MEKIISKIFRKIEKDPLDLQLYNDCFDGIKILYKSDKVKCFEFNRQLRQKCSAAKKQSRDWSFIEGIEEIRKESYHLEAKDVFDSYLIYLEWNRPANKKFWDNGEETGEQGFKDIAFLDLDGILFEQGTALNAWTCAQSEMENSGVIINSTGLNIADGKIYVTDPFGRKVFYIDGQQAMQLIGGFTTQIFDPVSKKVYAQSTIQPVYQSNPLDESGSLTGSGHLRQVFEKADENGKMQTLASIGMTFSNDKTINNDYPLSFFSKP